MPTSRQRWMPRWLVLSVAACVAVGAAWALQFEIRCLLGGIGINTFLPFTEDRYTESRERGDEILSALGTFREARGEYPSSLEPLVPTYLAAVRPPLVGTGKWSYRREAADRFVLSFFVGPMYESDWFDSKAGTWYADR